MTFLSKYLNTPICDVQESSSFPLAANPASFYAPSTFLQKVDVFQSKYLHIPIFCCNFAQNFENFVIEI